ncbi:hypothetical protein EF294_15315 [Gordonia oryzae]|uniref:Uncharacterized protein n=1 Tax=Gordonia oryzae TaxID=2487349 RepID=A0A3N4GD70_9ACTN|nr:hypothetical protein [Gordonia oryzae]RPA58536.1 hypothetical protein EF294_15315 [Gordonia oryzae]
MEPQEVLEKALAAVTVAQIPDDLREIAFSRAIDLYASGSVPSAQPAATSPASSATPESDQPKASTPNGNTGFYIAASKATGVSESRLEELIDIHERTPLVALRSSDLPSNAAKAQKIVGLLILVARHFYFDETETALSEVLEECKRLKCEDSNFKRNISRIDNLVILGSGKAATAKVRKPFIDGFADSLKNLGIPIE